MKYHIRNRELQGEGRKRIAWARRRMPVLELIEERFKKKKPLKSINIAACLHVTTETAVLMRVLKAGGARLRLCASNPLSTQDDVAASLVFDEGIEVFSLKGEDKKTYYRHIEEVLEINPQITMDDGADLVSTLHKKKPKVLPQGGTEETTTGVIRLRALEKEGRLLYPVIAVNDAYTKHLFDNRYGTGQSTIDGILRATNKLLAGANFVVCGYGWCGRGVAKRAAGMGASVIIAEVDALKALEAVMDGFRVMPLQEAVKIADVVVTVTGDVSVLREEHFLNMKEGALVANVGHFNVEINLKALKRVSLSQKEIKPLVKEYRIKSGRRVKSIYLLAEGRLANLACAEGHPAEVMDMSFANQALSCEYIVQRGRTLAKKVYSVPDEIDKNIARLKLKSLGIRIDSLTSEQKKYLDSWQLGT